MSMASRTKNFVLYYSLNEHGKPNKDLYLKVR